MESGTTAADPGPVVLVVDDSEPIRRLIRINLELDGFVVHEVTDGRAALQWLINPAHGTPGVIVMDAFMEPEDGWWAIAAIRAHPRLAGVPCVLVTASVQVHDRVQARESGFDAFVAKPFDPVELVAAVSHLAGAGRGWYGPP